MRKKENVNDEKIITVVEDLQQISSGEAVIKKVQEIYECKNNPNAKILIYALQHLGYDNYVALCDIIDNCIDAGATEIKICVQVKEGKFRIIIADNGEGMDQFTLDEALKLGSDVDRENDNDLGKFGMGLSTASLSLANITTVLTKMINSKEILKSRTSVDEIKAKNEFVKYLGIANEKDIELFNQITNCSESGTIVILEECIGIKNKNITQFVNKLKKDVARKFRRFMDKIVFEINDTIIEREDPLLLDDECTEVYSDEEYDVKWKDIYTGEEKTSKVNVKLVLLPDYGQDGNKTRGFNMTNQGFSVIRNNREIDFGYLPNGWITRHNKYNRFRGEISFSSEMDEPMGVDFRKAGIDMYDSVENSLRRQLLAQITAMGTKASKASRTSQDEINHNEAENLINKKAHLLITPKVQRETRQPKSQQAKDKVETTKEKESEKVRIPKKTQYVNANVRFETHSYGRGGAIFSAYQEGKVTVIEWNVDHPFYERFVIANKEDKTLVTSVDFMIYSLAVSQLQAIGDDPEKSSMIESIISIMSANMRALLS